MNNNRLQTNLLDAIRARNLDQVQSILNVGAHPYRVHWLFKSTESPLVLAVLVRSLPLVRLLLCKGAPVDEIGVAGYTPLQVACKYGDVEITKTLLIHGAKLDKFRHPPTPIAFAAFSGNAELVTLLLQQGANPNDVLANGITSVLRLKNEVLRELVKASKQIPDYIHQLLQD